MTKPLIGCIIAVGAGTVTMMARAEHEPPAQTKPLLATATVSTDAPKHALPPSKNGDLVVGMCDGRTSIEVKGVKEGTALERGEAQAVSDRLMAEWRKANPNVRWDAAPASRKTPASADGASGAARVALAQKPPTAPPVRKEGVTAETGAQQVPAKTDRVQSGHTYGAFGPRDEAIWKASTQAFVERGHKVFHDVKELGGTVGITCDMCHPDASNTHPETYPKYQVQLGRVALLRDMINWCIENPVRGKPLKDDDERLRAMEAYILAQRKGTKLDYGKH